MAVRLDKVIMIFFGFFISAMTTGCCMIIPAEPIQPAYITTEPPYIARLMFPYKKNEKIKRVKVYDYKTIEKFPYEKRTTCWDVKATEPVPAKGFRIKIGEVPDGFKQVIPKENISFVPALNNMYLVEIKTTNWGVSYLTWWEPGRVNWRF